MEKENKRLTGAVVTLAFFTAMLANAVYHPFASGRKASKETAQESTYEDATKEVSFWYTDEKLSDYFTDCAKAFFEETGIAVEVTCADSLGFVENICQTSMDDTDYPDVYMIQNDSLGKAYLYGIAAENEDADAFAQGYAQSAVTASSCDGIMYGYPMTFDTSILIYRTDVFGEAPKSMQSILDMALTSEAGLVAGNMIEWDVADEFYNFPFVGSSIFFTPADEKNLDVTYDEETYQAALAFYQKMADSVAIDSDTITRQQVLSDFNSGATLSAIIDSEDIGQITTENLGVSLLPSLNDEIAMTGMSYTDLLVINDYSNHKEQAADFARYVTVECQDTLAQATGNIPVKADAVLDAKSQIAYSQYENSYPVPNTVDVDEFLEELKSKMILVWNGGAF